MISNIGHNVWILRIWKFPLLNRHDRSMDARFRLSFHCKCIPGRPWRRGHSSLIHTDTLAACERHSVRGSHLTVITYRNNQWQPQPTIIPCLFNKTVNRRHIVGHRRPYQKWDHYNLQLIASDELYRSSPTKLQIWSREITPDQYFTDVFRCLSPSHTGLTTRLRPPCDRKMMASWENRRKNVRVVAEVGRLVAEVVGDRHGKISGNKVDRHVQNF